MVLLPCEAPGRRISELGFQGSEASQRTTFFRVFSSRAGVGRVRFWESLQKFKEKWRDSDCRALQFNEATH